MVSGMRPEQRNQVNDLRLIEDEPALEQCFEDWLDLHRLFASICDPSRMRAQAEAIAADPQPWQSKKIGEGTHFEVYRISAGLSPMSAVIKISRPGFSGLYPNPRIFEGLMQKLKSIHTVSLIPPMDVMQLMDQRVAIVMPYADQAQNAAAAHWLPLKRWLDHTALLLAEKNLEINDILQVRCVKHIPILYDYSDLSSTHTT